MRLENWAVGTEIKEIRRLRSWEKTKIIEIRTLLVIGVHCPKKEK